MAKIIWAMGGSSPQTTLQNANIVFAVLIGICLLMRLYTRLVLIRAFAIEDAMVTFSAILGIAGSVIVVSMTYYGLGAHLTYVESHYTEQQIQTFLKLDYAYSILYFIGTSFAKLAIATLMLRVFPVRWFRYFISVVMALVTIMCICAIAVSIAVGWTASLHPYKVLVEKQFNCVFSSLNAAFDLSLVVVPLPLVWKLQIPLQTRIPVCLLFATGIFGVIASVVRVRTIHDVSNDDVTYNFAMTVLWTTIEFSLAILCAIVPVLKPFFTYILPRGCISQPTMRQTSTRTGYTTHKSHRGHSPTGSDLHELKSPYVGVTRGGCYTEPDGFDDINMLPEYGVQVKTEINVATSYEPRQLGDSGSEVEVTTSYDANEFAGLTKPPKSLWR